ncbi:PaaX family transcriptional regulator C-terminal domain-containing protein [Zafaria cholistanensis]|uniref:PaaX family transcriptional regulator C-terminal domain-containing protein n=1 Tax=Zafaria cholistanensis TaxID=1682741 RepID=UPI00123141D7
MPGTTPVSLGAGASRWAPCRDAFRYCILMLRLWRRVPCRDPNLPLECFPRGMGVPGCRLVP